MKIIDSGEREVIVSEKYSLSRKNDVTPEISIHEKFLPDFRGRLAVQLVERWGLVAVTILDEENSAGRQKGVLMSPEDIVDRACNTADLMVSQLHRRGWMTPLPSQEEAKEMLKSESENQD